MNNVRSRPLQSPPPLPRRWLDNIAPGVRTLFGALFIAWSWISTIIIIGWLLEPLLHDTSTLVVVADRFVIGLVVAALVTIAELASAERWPLTHWLTLLIADASFTSIQTHSWLTQIIAPRAAITAAGDVGVWLAAIIGGIIAAKFGELLLFGTSRREG